MQTPDSDQIQAVIISQDTIDGLAEVSGLINADIAGISISPTGLYCQKTGHIIGNRDENSLFFLMKTHGKEQFVQALYECTTFNVHPSWTYTDGESLDALIDHDPIGYACYCFGIITAQFYASQKHHEANREPFAERYWAMARANALLHSRGVAEIENLNVELCKFLTYAPSTQSVLFRTIRKFAQAPDTLAILATTGELTDILHDCTNRVLNSLGIADSYIKRTKFMDFATTPADAARGPSNIRKQKASRRNVVENTLFAELAGMFNKDDFKPVKSTNDHLAAYRKQFAARAMTEREQDEKLLADLAALEDVQLDEFAAENDADDNEVEMRTVKLETPVILHEVPGFIFQSQIPLTAAIEDPAPEQQTASISTPTTTKPLSALERLRAMKK